MCPSLLLLNVDTHTNTYVSGSYISVIKDLSLNINEDVFITGTITTTVISERLKRVGSTFILVLFTNNLFTCSCNEVHLFHSPSLPSPPLRDFFRVGCPVPECPTSRRSRRGIDS